MIRSVTTPYNDLRGGSKPPKNRNFWFTFVLEYWREVLWGHNQIHLTVLSQEGARGDPRSESMQKGFMAAKSAPGLLKRHCSELPVSAPNLELDSSRGQAKQKGPKNLVKVRSHMIRRVTNPTMIGKRGFRSLNPPRRKGQLWVNNISHDPWSALNGDTAKFTWRHPPTPKNLGWSGYF